MTPSPPPAEERPVSRSPAAWGRRLLVLLADLCTLGRLSAALTLIGLGLTVGAPALPLAIVVTLLGWTCDALDGPLARWAGPALTTRLGRHDFTFDVTLAWATLLYLGLAGFLPLVPILVYLTLALLAIVRARRKAVTIALLRPVDITCVLTVLWHAPRWGGGVLAFLLLQLLLHWHRFFRNTRAWWRELTEMVAGYLSRGKA